MTRTPEHRAAIASFRQAADGAAKRIDGYAAVFNSPTKFGSWFQEQIAPGAFTDAIGRDDVRALFNHDNNLVLGRTKNGTLRLSEDERGLKIEIDPPDTQFARDLLASMERGDVDQMSFGFYVEKEMWDETVTPPMRTLLKVSLADVSVVTTPAYEDTEVHVVGLRSLEKARAELVDPVANIRRRMKIGIDTRRTA
jgi:uncharacterized protein